MSPLASHVISEHIIRQKAEADRQTDRQYTKYNTISRSSQKQ